MEAEPLSSTHSEEKNKFGKGAFAVVGIMSTLLIYGVLQIFGEPSLQMSHWSPDMETYIRVSVLKNRNGTLLECILDKWRWAGDGSKYDMVEKVHFLQEKIMTVPYGEKKEYFKYSLFLVFCNRLTTSAVSAGALLASKKALDPVAPLYKYCLVSVSNILTTTCQYEALKYVSFPVQTLAKCAKMIPVMIWSTAIMQKVYKANDYFLASLVMIGCALFILYPVAGDNSQYNNRGRESTVWGVSLMIGYLGFDGFTSTFQDKLFRGYEMEIHNQIFYTTLCSCIFSLTCLILQGDLLMAIDFVGRHNDCFFDVALLSIVATASQFFISYTIQTFGALTFATIMTTRQLVSILLSCMWFVHPLSWEQGIGAAIVFGSLYAKSFMKNKPQKPSQMDQSEDEESIPLKENA